MDFTVPTLFWCASAALFAFAFLAAWAERRRAKRRNLDRPGLIPWNLLQVFAFILAIVAATLALKV